MRLLDAREMRKRGCSFCKLRVSKRRGFVVSSYCPHEKCPFNETDGFETYNQYLKTKGDLIFLRRKGKV